MRPPPSTPLPRLALLFLLYVVQGLPFGFQARALPAYLREAGTSLTIITLTSALSLPWMLKALWAPWVDRAHGSRLGRRRAWILPMQLGLALCCAAAAYTDPESQLAALLALVLLMNLCTAIMDIAVDGLAVDSLAPGDLGHGNIAQVVGYKLGMITSGGLLLAHADTIGWSGMLAFITAAVLAGLLAMLLFRETPATTAHSADEPDDAPPARVRDVLALIVAALHSRAARWIVIFIATYKLGEAMADALFVPFLIDAGFDLADIGLWLGTYGMIASIAGSIAGGLVASRTSFVRAVGITAVLRVVPIVGQWWLTLHAPTAGEVIAVTLAEHLAGGALTTAMFAFMMSQVDRRVGATHYTVFATIEVLGKSATGTLAGALADASSYPAVYGLAAALSAAFLLLLIPLTRRLG